MFITSILIPSTSFDTLRMITRDPKTSIITMLLTKISKIKLDSSGIRRLKRYVAAVMNPSTVPIYE